MEVKVIGFWGAYPEKNEATSCYLLKRGDYQLVIDLGSGALSRLQNYINLKDLDAVVLSHFHNDHIADVGSLQYACLVEEQLKQRSNKLPIYSHQKDPQAFQQLTHQATVGRAYQANGSQTIGPFNFTFLATKHPKHCYAMRIELDGLTVVYTADTSYFEELDTFSKGADLLIAETSFYKGMNGKSAGHMTSEEVGRLATKAGVKELWLTHLPHFGDHQQLLSEAAEHFTGKIELAHEGLTWARKD
ncbi:MBL fold metallo-hydrolase [Piscibacillus halophilus]|uniref:Ribonuclease BN, tRNA processing enzyme n=1 Tax=Piscibacillus halophilus TaxID=571933 RepID=A0A1H9B0D8_9BACI|nr:MBL fold metallo-hydrolase [Piscibacillus halophilus]SEP81698.1 Ribonuclease BN, tRNA processing enzyme [Piscibacillus halophilus]